MGSGVSHFSASGFGRCPLLETILVHVIGSDRSTIANRSSGRLQEFDATSRDISRPSGSFCGDPKLTRSRKKVNQRRFFSGDQVARVSGRGTRVKLAGRRAVKIKNQVYHSHSLFVPASAPAAASFRTQSRMQAKADAWVSKEGIERKWQLRANTSANVFTWLPIQRRQCHVRNASRRDSCDIAFRIG